MMPRFFKDMPPRKAGLYQAAVIRATHWSRREIWTCQVRGQRRAYVVARLAALFYAFNTIGEDFAVEWAVGPVTIDL